MQTGLGQPQKPVRVHTDGIAPQRRVADGVIQMILRVLPDARQSSRNGDAVTAQFIFGANPRQQKKLWRVKRALRHNHLAPRLRNPPY